MAYKFLCAVLMLAMPTMAFAYIDAGSGSYFLQVGLAGLMGLLFAVKLAWQNLRQRTLHLMRVGDRDQSRS